MVAAGQVAVSLLACGLLDTASRSAARSAEQARDVSHPAVISVASARVAGYIFLSLGELEIAERYANELIDHAAIRGLHPLYAIGFCVRGSVAVKRADPAAGVDLLRRGLTDMRGTSYQLYYPFFLAELAAGLGALGRVEESLVEIDAALGFAAQTGNRWFVPEALRIKGHLLARRDPGDAAIEACFVEGAAMARAQGALFWELRNAVALARLRAAQERGGDARDILLPVYGRFVEGFDTPDLCAARAFLDELRG